MSRLLRSLLVVTLLATAAACRRSTTETVEATGPLVVRAEPAVIEALRATVVVTGAVAPSPGADWMIVAPDNARVADLTKNEGDPVKAGDVLVKFDVPSIALDVAARRSELAQANARLLTAKAAATRVSGLFARGIVPQKEHDDATRELQDAESAVAHALNAQQALESVAARTVVSARFDGVVLKRFHNVGDQVTASAADPVLRVIDPTRLEIAGTFPAAQLALVRPGMTARIMNPIDGAVVEGTVLTVPQSLDSAATTADIRIALPAATPPGATPGTPGATGPAVPAPATPAAKPGDPVAIVPMQTVGTPVQCEIYADERQGAIVIPTAAILRDGLQAYVMVAGQDGKAHRKSVMVGLIARERAQILSGLVAGERVIVAGAEPVPDGATITIQR